MFYEKHAADARQVYDSVADDYMAFVGTELSDKTEDAVDRSILGAFVELATSLGTHRPIADLGCGPGRVAAVLQRSGLETIGIDVSPRLARLALNAHPTIAFAAGRISALPLADRCLDGGVSWYSIIYTPPQHLDRVFEEIARVVAPDGLLLLGYQAGPAQPVHRSDAFGSGFPLTSFRHEPDHVGAVLEASEFSIHSTTIRPPALAHEDCPQAFTIARRQRGA